MSCDPSWEVCDTPASAAPSEASPVEGAPARAATTKGAAVFLVNLMWANVLY